MLRLGLSKILDGLFKHVEGVGQIEERIQVKGEVHFTLQLIKRG